MSKIRENNTIEGWRIPPNPEGPLWKEVKKFSIEEFLKNLKPREVMTE